MQGFVFVVQKFTVELGTARGIWKHCAPSPAADVSAAAASAPATHVESTPAVDVRTAAVSTSAADVERFLMLTEEQMIFQQQDD
jgi:hypothetical protein